ncbi:MAG: FAD-dependent oxidoreductase [Pseudomonadota bacterium]
MTDLSSTPDLRRHDGFDTSVLIIGGGPVGLALALDLSQRNIDSTIVEQGDGIVRLSKMGLVSMRSMEYCRRWGIADRVRDCGFPLDYPLSQVFCTSLVGHLIAKIEYPSMAQESANGLSPEKKQRCPQLWFDPILAGAVKERDNVDVRYNSVLKSFSQDEDGVTAMVQEQGEDAVRPLRAQYLVGCDGAGSTVRKALGITLEGDQALSYSVGIYFRAPGLVKYHNMGPAERYMLIGEEGTWGNLTVVDGSDVWRLTVLGTQDKVEDAGFDADYWLRRCLGRNDVPYQIDAVMPWRRSRLVADAYCKGRVFLAGDACHVMAPNGGYGMNTGLGDAIDLSWKLQAVLQGWAGPDLLASYEIERQPIAQRNVNAAAQNFSTMAPKLDFAHVEDNDAVGAAARSRMETQMSVGTRQEWEPHGINLGYRYEGSPIVCADGSPATEDHPSHYLPTARPGHRAPHVPLADGTSIIDLFGDTFVLLTFGQPVAADAIVGAAKALGIPLRHQHIVEAQAAKAYERRFVLVRPDGHVAWRADTLPSDPAAVLRTVVGMTNAVVLN